MGCDVNYVRKLHGRKSECKISLYCRHSGLDPLSSNMSNMPKGSLRLEAAMTVR
jgi:hypothetical protein